MHNNNLEDTDTILIGDTITKDIRTAKMDNYFVPETSVSQLTEMISGHFLEQRWRRCLWLAVYLCYLFCVLYFIAFILWSGILTGV